MADPLASRSMHANSPEQRWKPGMTEDGMRALRHTFLGAGLALPPIPERLEHGFERLEDWLFGTRPVVRKDTYMLTPYLEEARAGGVEDYVAVTHGGHGVNSYSLNYLLVLDPIIVMTQTLYGGIYTDNEIAIRSWGRQVDGINELLAKASTLTRAGLGGRLVVSDSNYRFLLSGWEFIPDGRTSEEERRHKRSAAGIFRDVIVWLSETVERGG